MAAGMLVLFLMISFWLATSVKICEENQRLAVFRLGRYVGLRGPGLVLVIPSIERAVKISLNDRGQILDAETANIKNVAVPVAQDGVVPVGAGVRVTGFHEPRTIGSAEAASHLKVRVAIDYDQGKTVRCDKCGHEMKI